MPKYDVVSEVSFEMTSKPKIVVSLVDNGKSTNLNMREYYEDKITREFLPSKAGLFLPLTETDKPIVVKMLTTALITIGVTKDEIIKAFEKPIKTPKASASNKAKNKNN